MLILAMITTLLCMFITAIFLGGNAIYNSFSNFGFTYLIFVVTYMALRWLERKKNFFESFSDEFLITNCGYLALLAWGCLGFFILKKLGYSMPMSDTIKELLFYGSALVSILSAGYGLQMLTVCSYEPPIRKN